MIKYHVFEGRCGYVLRVCKRVGVMMDGSIAEGICSQGGVGVILENSSTRVRLLYVVIWRGAPLPLFKLHPSLDVPQQR